ncbi:MAG: hypothetical protein M3521_05585 [Acidobacteriota bacterium]|nr:hypothetical protein [Acidobacteriota bacterium]
MKLVRFVKLALVMIVLTTPFPGVKTAATATAENATTIAANANCRSLTTAIIFFIGPNVSAATAPTNTDVICLIFIIFLLLVDFNFFIIYDCEKPFG